MIARCLIRFREHLSKGRYDVHRNGLREWAKWAGADRMCVGTDLTTGCCWPLCLNTDLPTSQRSQADFAPERQRDSRPDRQTIRSASRGVVTE
jgi:hypothetical protein